MAVIETHGTTAAVGVESGSIGTADDPEPSEQ